MKISSFI